jgi:nucleoside-diphosphate-sugar epimerase
VDAERRLRRFGRQRGRHCRISILRAPGIYAEDRLPLERLHKRLPLVLHAEDSHTNHIHAADLGRACSAALARAGANRIYNINDDSSLAMGEWFDALADAFALPRAPRLPREEVRLIVPPMQWSFMAESRRLDNTRMKRELRLRLRYPTVATGIMAATATATRTETSCSG